MLKEWEMGGNAAVMGDEGCCRNGRGEMKDAARTEDAAVMRDKRCCKDGR